MSRRAPLESPALDVTVLLISVVLVGLFMVLVIYFWEKYKQGRRHAAAASRPDVPVVDPAAQARAATELATTGRVVFRRKPDPAAVIGSLLFPSAPLTVMPCLWCTWATLETTILAFLFLGFAARELMWLHPRNAIILTDHALSDNRPPMP